LRSRKLITDRLKLAGYDFTLQDVDDVLILSIDPRRRLRIPRLNLILFFLTLFTVYFVPVFLKNLPAAIPDTLAENGSGALSIWEEIVLIFRILPDAFLGTLSDLAAGAGIEFTVAMISILFVHEMGHYIASRRRGIITSWPYFIPAPNIIGTFGAVIKSKSPFRNRRDLVEVGAAGPIAGWVVAVAWLVYGLTKSTALPAQVWSIKELQFSLHGESILMKLLTLTIIGPVPEGHYYLLTEAAFAGWVGLLVTAINLLPIGQLDGGHIIYGLGRQVQRTLGSIALAGLILLGFDSPIWWFFAGFGILFGVGHPPTMDDGRELSRTAATMGVAALIIFVLSFTPIPFRW
jgi:membrane-associated protease RseP (regulator of RpoE activity)